MLARERLDIVAVATNTKMRADLTCLAVEHGAKGIVTEKPMAHTLEQADRMVTMCADAGVALSCGAISTTHPSFARARALVTSGGIGDVVSIEASGPGAQHQNWSYFVDSPPAWVIGIGDEPRRESGSDEFSGQGMMVAADGQVVHYRTGAPGVRITGSRARLPTATSRAGGSGSTWPGWRPTSGSRCPGRSRTSFPLTAPSTRSMT